MPVARSNLTRVMDQASPDDWQIAKQAYWRYHIILSSLSGSLSIPLKTGAAVFAALSPNNDYLSNVRDAGRMLNAKRLGLGIDDFKVSTYGANKRKAWAIVNGADPLELIKANKTRNFFLNITDPNDPLPVTIDGHIFNAWENVQRPLSSADMKANAKHYHRVADEIREMGADLKLVPNVVQAVIWFCWKRKHQIKHSDQIEIWSADFLAAGLGFQMESRSLPEPTKEWKSNYMAKFTKD